MLNRFAKVNAVFEKTVAFARLDFEYFLATRIGVEAFVPFFMSSGYTSVETCL